MHNTCSTFCKLFDGFASKLFTEIHNDLKWSEDLKEYFRDVCDILDIKFTMPARFVSHRLLSVYDISIPPCLGFTVELRAIGFAARCIRALFVARCAPAWEEDTVHHYRTAGTNADSYQRRGCDVRPLGSE